MSREKNFVWISPDKKVSELTSKEIVIIYIFKKISPYLTKITRFFPFSLLWQDRRFHYKHKRTTEADDLTIKIAGEKGFWFTLFSYDADDRSLNIIGKFTPLRKGARKDTLFRHFREKMEKEEFYINELADGSVKLSFIQKQ